ncbi:SH3 domain-containing protein [Evansella clarkii]|uniref:SH3 domain-containing protein n=1 Tax=Evansella clarkii TaxID=79879 RepID=UPI000B43B489|nr:SH3 domain-containing protein [Evansella clarkii]
MSNIDPDKMASVLNTMGSIEASKASFSDRLTSGIDTNKIASFGNLMSNIDPDKMASVLNTMGSIEASKASFSDRLTSGIDTNKIASFGNLMSSIDPDKMASVLNNMASIEASKASFSDRLTSGVAANKVASFGNLISSIEPNKMASLDRIFSLYKERLVEVDWNNVEVTDENIEEAIEMIESEDIEEKFKEEVDDNNDPNSVSGKLKTFLLVVITLVQLISDLINIAQYTEDTLIPKTRSYIDYKQEGSFTSEKAGIKWLNDELKKDVSQQITNQFRIVTKDGLNVYKQKTKNSRINAKLETGNVVQIIQKERNWCYVIYSDYENNQIKEGWVFTRYLAQIK